jgi:hypothetical protein
MCTVTGTPSVRSAPVADGGGRLVREIAHEGGIRGCTSVRGCQPPCDALQQDAWSVTAVCPLFASVAGGPLPTTTQRASERFANWLTRSDMVRPQVCRASCTDAKVKETVGYLTAPIESPRTS